MIYNTSKIEFLNSVISLLPDCISLDVKRFIACQFALESSFGQSPFALSNNNYCGMKVPVLRLTLCLNILEKNQLAQFSGIVSCVHDYLLWLQSMKFSRKELSDFDLFVRHMVVSGYCPETDYVDKVLNLYHEYYCYI